MRLLTAPRNARCRRWRRRVGHVEKQAFPLRSAGVPVARRGGECVGSGGSPEHLCEGLHKLGSDHTKLLCYYPLEGRPGGDGGPADGQNASNQLFHRSEARWHQRQPESSPVQGPRGRGTPRPDTCHHSPSAHPVGYFLVSVGQRTVCQRVHPFGEDSIPPRRPGRHRPGERTGSSNRVLTHAAVAMDAMPASRCGHGISPGIGFAPVLVACAVRHQAIPAEGFASRNSLSPAPALGWWVQRLRRGV